MDRHRIAELTSIELHREIVRRLRDDPSVLREAKARVRRWLDSGEVAPPYAEAWAQLLGEPLAGLSAFLVEDSDRARALRQVTPFAGALDARTRWAIWKRTRRQLAVGT